MRLSFLILAVALLLTSTEALFAASWDVEFRDGRVVTVEAPPGANQTQIGFLAIRALEAQDTEMAQENEVQAEQPSKVELSREEEGQLTLTANEEERRALTDDEKAEEQLEWDRRYKIFTRCYIDKMSGISEKGSVERRVDYQCWETSADPSLFQKWKYLYFW